MYSYTVYYDKDLGDRWEYNLKFTVHLDHRGAHKAAESVLHDFLGGGIKYRVTKVTCD